MQPQSIKLLIAALTLAGTFAFAQSADFDIAAGKLVTSSRPAAEAYPDGDGLKLTDGAYAFAWADMVGFEGAEPVALTVDLGAVYDTISYVALKVMRSDGSAVSLPTAIVSVSEDGVLWEDLGLANVALEGEVANDTIGTLVWADEAWAGYGQYVRVELLPGGGWTMVAELQVGNGAVPADRLPAASGNTPASAEAVNVALGKTYSLQPAASEAYPDPDGAKLTDGAYAYSWADMVGIADATFNPVVVVDLGEHVDGITRVAGLFMRSFASAVNLPYSILVSVSDDGENFTVVGLAAKTAPSPAMNELINSVYWEDLQEPVGGRYVKLQIRQRTGWLMLAEVVVQTGAAVPEVQEAAE